MKEFLSRAGHAFIERSVDQDDTAYDELLALGYRAVPLTIIDSTVIVGFNAEALRTALGERAMDQ